MALIEGMHSNILQSLYGNIASFRYKGTTVCINLILDSLVSYELRLVPSQAWLLNLAE